MVIFVDEETKARLAPQTSAGHEGVDQRRKAALPLWARK